MPGIRFILAENGDFLVEEDGTTFIIMEDSTPETRVLVPSQTLYSVKYGFFPDRD